MEATTLIARARTGLGKQTPYKSPGSILPLGAATWPTGVTSDCTGFLAWVLRISRKVDHPLYQKVNGGWFETTAIFADGKQATGYFDPITAPKPGAFLVYGDYIGSDGRSHDGHIGLVTETNGRTGIDGVKGVIHCSLGGWRNHGDAIRETDAAIWKARPSLIIWREGVS